jgi:hypothetical protein
MLIKIAMVDRQLKKVEAIALQESAKTFRETPKAASTGGETPFESVVAAAAASASAGAGSEKNTKIIPNTKAEATAGDEQFESGVEANTPVEKDGKAAEAPLAEAKEGVKEDEAKVQQ